MKRTRTYRRWTPPRPPGPAPSAPTVEINGITLFCHGLLSHPQNWNPRPLAFLSVAGPREAVKGVLASALTRHELNFTEPPPDPGWGYHPQFVVHHGSEDQYRTLSRRLPSGQVHGLLFPANALPTHTGNTFTLLIQQHTNHLAPARLLDAIDRRTELPLHANWASWLWDTALAADWLTPLVGFGPWTGWYVSYTETHLAQAISEALKTQSLTIPLPTPDTASSTSL